MRYCKKNPKTANNIGYWLLLFLLLPVYVMADGIVVSKAEIRMAETDYQLSAKFNINLSRALENALSYGVSLDFISEFSLKRKRWYWLDVVASKTISHSKLSYNTLTRQYRIKRGNLFQNFSNLDDALRVLGSQASNRIAAELLNQDDDAAEASNFTANARMSLDVSQLPKPLQANVLTSEEWRLESELYSWNLTSAEIAQARRPK